MRQLVFVTNNLHKLSEIRQICSGRFRILSLDEIGFCGDIEETASDLEGNALLKARHIHRIFGVDCFADDTGLEVTALNGAPGVVSARYAGQNASFSDNVKKLLHALDGENERSARFRTVIALIIDNQEYLFEGTVEGSIADKSSGSGGFGYDPVFVPKGFAVSFAEMSPDEKNRISHRGMAIRKLEEFLARHLPGQ